MRAYAHAAMAHANIDFHMDFISLLSLSNNGVILPELLLAQKKQAALAPEASEAVQGNGVALGSSSNGFYHLSNGVGLGKLNGVKRSRVTAGPEEGLAEYSQVEGYPAMKVCE